MKTRAHVFVSGYVQGVFFREMTKRQSESLNVKGWVRNRDDGRVEAVFEGEEQNVEKMVGFCRRGPPRATVTATEVKWEDYLGESDSFDIRF